MEKLLTNDESSFADIEDNYKRICENIGNAVLKAGRQDSVRLMAVTKTVSVEKINHAVGLGVKLLGENRVQEYLSKCDGYSKDAEVHFIGGLQTNKVKYITDKVTMIHSVDRLELAAEISKRSAKLGKTMDILVEINIGDEETKNGISRDKTDEFIEKLLILPNIRLRGLMAIPPVNSGEKIFSEMNKIFIDISGKKGDNSKVSNFKWDTLSMGMSGDYEKAIYYGSNLVRIGSGLFGYRKYKTEEI